MSKKFHYKIVEDFVGTEFEDCCIYDSEEKESWLRFDIPDSDPKEQWDEYICVLEGLRKIGYDLHEPLVEHDCISGTITESE
jgi:hypothetical protein